MTENGWVRVRLGDVAHQVSDHEHDPAAAGLKRFVGLEHLDPEHIMVERWGSIADGTTFTKRFQAGQLLFAKRRAYQRKAAVADFDGLCSGDLIVIEATSETLLPELLPHIVHTDRFLDHALRTSSGSLSPRTKWKDLADYEFEIPPLNRQRELVVVFDGLERAVRSNRRLAAAAVEVSRSLIHEVMSTHPSQPLSDVGVVQVGRPFKSASFTDSGTRLLRGANVGVDQLNWDPDVTRYWDAADSEELSGFLLREGDLIVALDRPFIGGGFKVASVEESDLPALLVQRVARISPPDGYNADILWAWLHSPDLIAHLGLYQRGSSIPHIFVGDLRSAPLPVLDLTEQAELGSQFREAEQRSKGSGVVSQTAGIRTT